MTNLIKGHCKIHYSEVCWCPPQVQLVGFQRSVVSKTYVAGTRWYLFLHG